MPKDFPASDAAAQTEIIEADFCVIGAGSGGLALAAAAAAYGQRVVLIEKHKMGGDGLNYGSVPSKALLAAAKRANAMRTASLFGIRGVEPLIDHRAVQEHVKDVIARIAPNAAVERFAGLGVRVITAAGRFVDKSTVSAGDYRIRARRFVIATGSSPVIPPIPGLADVPYFTNESIFENAAPTSAFDRHRRRIDGARVRASLSPSRLAPDGDRCRPMPLRTKIPKSQSSCSPDLPTKASTSARASGLPVSQVIRTALRSRSKAVTEPKPSKAAICLLPLGGRPMLPIWDSRRPASRRQ